MTLGENIMPPKDKMLSVDVSGNAILVIIFESSEERGSNMFPAVRFNASVILKFL